MGEDYKNAKLIRNYIVQRSAEVMNYTNWSEEFSTKQIREIPEIVARKIPLINIGNLTSEEMNDLGFGYWSESNPMRLIPLWLFKFLPEKIESKCIDGTTSILNKSEMDNDTRFGCLAYGIVPQDYQSVELVE